MNKIFFGDNLKILKSLPDESVDLIYIDPPFNTGKIQARTTIRTIKAENGDRRGFQGNNYQTIDIGTKAYDDDFNSKNFGEISNAFKSSYEITMPEISLQFIELFLKPRMEEAYRILKKTGSLYFHIDYREVHYCKILLDNIFGRESFLNEIIWAYDFGGKPKSKWPPKHDNILLYVKDPDTYTFNIENIERENYMAPGLVGLEKAIKGKLPTDTWWHSIVGTNSKERTGYPTQKPLGIIDRIIKASSNVNDLIIDFFAGSGTIGESCLRNNRRFILVDNNEESMQVMAKRFSRIEGIEWIGFDPTPFFDHEKKVVKNEIEKQLTEEYKNLIKIVNIHKNEYLISDSKWENSPFYGINYLSPAQKGALGKKIVSDWFTSLGLDVVHSKEIGVDFEINKVKFAIKTSFLWENNIYNFQQIRNQSFDYIICFGISPEEIHCWIVNKDKAIKNSVPQHGGEKGKDTFWFQVKPNKPNAWLNGLGGDLEITKQVLFRIINA